jgi:methylenetetrahydrofolate reductase (NADPH)
MKIHENIEKKGKSLSFEFFPPRDPAGEKKLFPVIKKLESLGPDFVSVTYGAGGGSRKNTAALVERIKADTSLNPMPHLTCIGQTEKDLRTILDYYKELGIENILALRGDFPKGTGEEDYPEDCLTCAKDLVDLTSSYRAFSIGVACYPEGHIEAPSLEKDLLFTKRKIDSGAHFAITQMFFENRFFFEFLERAEKIGIHIPIIPGIMPIFDIKKTAEFCRRCGTTIPASLANRMGRASPEDAARIGREFAVAQCIDLIRQGIRYFHFYSMNQAESAIEILGNLSLVQPRVLIG